MAPHARLENKCDERSVMQKGRRAHKIVRSSLAQDNPCDYYAIIHVKSFFQGIGGDPQSMSAAHISPVLFLVVGRASPSQSVFSEELIAHGRLRSGNMCISYTAVSEVKEEAEPFI